MRKDLKNKNSSRGYRHENHRKPRTRREFLSQGFLSSSALMMGGGLTSFLSRTAFAQDCEVVTGPGMTPFLVFDMAGGAALPGNFLVGKEGGPKDFLRSYDLLGWNPRASGALFEGFGLPMAKDVSYLLRGIQATASQQAQDRLRLASVCHIGQDDSSNNQLSVLALVQRAGLTGAYVPNGIGSENSASGGNSRLVAVDAENRPIAISRIGDIVGAVNYGGSTLSDIRKPAVKAIADTGPTLAALQLEKYKSLAGSELLSRLGLCSYQKAKDLFNGSVSSVDPRNNGNVQGLYGIDGNTAEGSTACIEAAIAFNVIQGYSGPGAWTLGGFDYHGQAQSVSDNKDQEMGAAIGRALELAYQSNKPLFFQIVTDGGCSANQGTRSWQSDSGDKSMTIMGYFNPDATPTYRNGRMQIGSYSDGQGVSQASLVGGVPFKAGLAVFANYLNIHGRLGEFERFAPGVFSSQELDQLIAFEKVSQ